MMILTELIDRYKSDPESVYNTWFVSSEDRMKAFRAIRRGVRDTVESIAAGTFGTDFKGSPLEVVLTAITEQKQVFQGAAHAFFWKPKLRIPDIYENDANKRTFAAFLEACLTATREEQVLAQMSRLAAAQIKGLGPAVANIIYFLHPTLVPPFNTAMVKGFNALFGDRKQLGSWESYLAMRAVIVHTNAEVRDRLSKDLGAFAGLLFEVGSGRLLVGGNVDAVLAAEKVKAEKTARARHADVVSEQAEESEHTRIQYLLIKVGRALKYVVYVARNDRHRSYDGQAFALLTVPELPPMDWPPEVMETVSLIDVIWLKPTGEFVSAFEVEKSTSIYSGILRLEDLVRSIPGCTCQVYLVAPDEREKEVMAQLARPAFRGDLADISLAFIPFGALCEHCDALCKFGENHSILSKIARTTTAVDKR
ncbi:MAG: type II restriction endonuclease [Nitrospiraceae bacterium]|nr:type II restriction endonuclease [Nitrospiraceae bacterium]